MFYIKNFEKQTYSMNDFIKDAERLLKDPYENTDVQKYPLTNVGYFDTILVVELALAGFKKENIKVNYVGNVVTVSATYEEENKINYIQKNISTKNIERKIYLTNEYLGGEVKWKYVNGLLTIAIKPSIDNTPQIEASEDNTNLFSTQTEQGETTQTTGTSESSEEITVNNP